MQLLHILQLLALMTLANGAPIVAKKIFGPRFSFPLDAGTRLRPLNSFLRNQLDLRESIRPGQTPVRSIVRTASLRTASTPRRNVRTASNPEECIENATCA